jgi:hypothetical protein
MSYSIQDLYARLEGVLHGTTTNQITNLDGLIYSAAGQLLLDVDPQETKCEQPLASTIFNSVFDYPLPSDLKGNAIIDIFPQVDRKSYDLITQTYGQNFDVNKGDFNLSNCTIQFNNGIKTLRLKNVNLPVPFPIDSCDTLTDNAVSGTASGLVVDNVNYVSNTASLKFDLAAGANPSTGGVTYTPTTALDLSLMYNQASIFAWVFLPKASDVISITIKWGSDNSNYYSRTLVTTQEQLSFQNGWNQIKGDWLGSTVVGSPVNTAIDYFDVSINYDGTAQTACRIDSIQMILGTILNISYYSKYLFSDAVTGAFQEKVTDVSNLINLDTESYNLLFYKVAEFAAQQQQGEDSKFDGSNWARQYTDALNKYKVMYKSEKQKPSQTYYRPDKGGYTKYVGGRWNY